METLLQDVLVQLVMKYPLAATLYAGVTGAFAVFCTVATFTKTDKDDKLADKMRRLFSLPTKKPE